MVTDREDAAQLVEKVEAKKPDLVEFRLDQTKDLATIETIAQKKTFPAIVADRSKRDARTSREFQDAVVAAGFEFVDVDIGSSDARAAVQNAKSQGAQVIVSSHDFSETPTVAKLQSIRVSAITLGADICKIVTTAQHPRDNLTVLGFLAAKPAEARIVSFAMGAIGTPSRILAPLFGAEFTFASLTEQSRTAEGQLTIDNIRSVWQLLGIQ
jgi:3-dehydroquinate dehydratase-1